MGLKVNILFPFREASWGGGNQFLKALREEFLAMGVYEESPETADVVIFNSHHLLWRVAFLALRFPGKVFIHRVDGPISLVRGFDEGVDRIIQIASRCFASGVIFQSEYSRVENLNRGFILPRFYRVILNSPDKRIFPRKPSGRVGGRKIRLISTSWSKNIRKGFSVYKYLDETLDFSKYSYLFVGNAPIKFRNIKAIPPVSSPTLSKYLFNSDVYITASQKDPCSNALIEALACGLPVIALRDGGHPELVGSGGELFERQDEIPGLIEKVSSMYTTYQNNIIPYNITTSAEMYLDFALLVAREQNVVGRGYAHSWYGFILFAVCRAWYTLFGELSRWVRGSSRNALY